MNKTNRECTRMSSPLFVRLTNADEFFFIRVNSRPFAVVSAFEFVGTYFSGRPFAVVSTHLLDCWAYFSRHPFAVVSSFALLAPIFLAVHSRFPIWSVEPSASDAIPADAR
jgi:hypothetical protein